ncbi:unnamed protein product [Gadus morhua 'NCC']
MDKSNMNSFLEYTICNRPGAGTYSTPKSGYHSHPHHHHHHHQGFPVTSGAFHLGPNGSSTTINGPSDEDTGGANFTSDVRLYAGPGAVGGGAPESSGVTAGHHSHSHNSYHHPHLHQAQTMPNAMGLSQYNTTGNVGNNGAYVAVQNCANNADYTGASGHVNTTHSSGVHSQYFIDDSSMSATYYHQSTFASTTPSQAPSYGALAGAYCGGPQGNLPAAQYPQHLGGSVEGPGYVGLPHGGGYADLTVSLQERERVDEENQAAQGKTFDWMKVKRNPPKTVKASDYGLAAAHNVNPNQLLHQAADGAGEGVPLQQVPHAGSARGDRRHAGPQRDAGEDLVPKPAHEAEEAGTRGRPRARLLVKWPRFQ